MPPLEEKHVASWWFGCTLLIIMSAIAIENGLSAVGPSIGVPRHSIRYWVLIVIAAIGLLCISSMLASAFYDARLGWQVSLSFSHQGFVELVAFSHLVIVSLSFGLKA